jgi:hypothetical protein
MRLTLVLLITVMILPSCAHRATSMKSLLGKEDVEVRYLLSDGRWVRQDSLSWSHKSFYRELRFDTDGNGRWNYLYAEVYDDVAGWTWIPSSARVNPREEPHVARTKRHLVREREIPPCQPGLDDFGYRQQ